MNRRRVLRVVLAGGVGGLSLPLAACDRLEPSTVAAWNGPPADLADPRLRALAWALLAPSPHNTQPWLADLPDDGAILLRVDAACRLHAVDPLGRQTLIGQGTFLEALVLAAEGEGHKADVAAFPDGAFPPETPDARPVASVRLRPEPGTSASPLLTALPRRRSTKLAFDPEKPVTPEHQTALRKVVAGRPVEFGLAVEPEPVLAVRELARRALHAEYGHPPALAETVRWLRLGADAVMLHPDGIPITGVASWWLRRLGLLTPERLATPGSLAWRSGLTMWDNLLTGSPSFGWLVTADDSREAQLAAGRAYLRVDLAAALNGVAIHPVSQALGDHPVVAEHRAELDRLLGISPPARVQMLFRLGYAGPQAPSPRRPLKAILAV